MILKEVSIKINCIQIFLLTSYLKFEEKNVIKKRYLTKLKSILLIMLSYWIIKSLYLNIIYLNFDCYCFIKINLIFYQTIPLISYYNS